MVKINMSCLEADFMFPCDEEGRATGEYEKDEVEEYFVEHILTQYVPEPQFHGFSDWVFYDSHGAVAYCEPPESNDMFLDVARCKVTLSDGTVSDVLWRCWL